MDTTTRALLTLAVWVLASGLYCVVVTTAARTRSARTLWKGWAALVVGLFVVSFARLAGDQWARSLGLGYGALVAAGIFGVPTAAALWLAIRRARVEKPHKLFLDLVIVAAGYLGVLLVTFTLLSIPDIVVLLGH